MTAPETLTEYAVQGRIEGTDRWAHLDPRYTFLYHRYAATTSAKATWNSSHAEAEQQEQQAQKSGGWKETRIIAREVSEPWVVSDD